MFKFILCSKLSLALATLWVIATVTFFLNESIHEEIFSEKESSPLKMVHGEISIR